MITALTALVLYVAGLLLAFGLRSVLHRRATGDSGFRHPAHSSAGSPLWWSQVMLGAALLGGPRLPHSCSPVCSPRDRY